MEQKLGRCVAAWCPGATGVVGVTRLSGGASQETWSFDIVHPDSNIGAILRRAQEGEPDGGRLRFDATGSTTGNGLELSADGKAMKKFVGWDAYKGVIAEIVVFALSPRFTLAPATLVVIGALSAVARW